LFSITKYLFSMARKNALRDSPAGEPRQGVKVCDLLNSGAVPLRYMLRINTQERTYANFVCVLAVQALSGSVASQSQRVLKLLNCIAHVIGFLIILSVLTKFSPADTLDELGQRLRLQVWKIESHNNAI
jgi:hypothetical protein